MVELPTLHERPNEMKAALEFTARETGFALRFLEKDYWCSLVLGSLYRDDCPLVFKGGTLLSKAFTGFNRLSEDLDFTLPTLPDTSRKTRSTRAKQVEAQLNRLVDDLHLTWAEVWQGHNNSKQYTGRIKYPSILGVRESVLIEVGQREPVLDRVTETPLKTLLQDPIHNEPVIPPFTAKALSLKEAYAEKVRAALTRERPAIRDLYDIWMAGRLDVLPLGDAGWIEMIRHKCEGLDLSDTLSNSRVQEFKAGIESDLDPMLRNEATKDFQFQQAVELLETLLNQL